MIRFLRNQPGILIIVALILFYSCKQNGFDGKNGKRIAYVEGTKIILQSVEYKNGLKNGEFIDNYKNGQLHYRAWYVNDTLQDSMVYYHPNGKLFSVGYYDKGRKTGCWKKYNDQGMLYRLMCFKDDQFDSISLKYSYKSGNLIERLNYKNGDKEGKQEYFYNSGKPKSVAYFSDNRPCIGLQEWYESGKKVDNDFLITIEEQNRVLMEGVLKVLVHLQNPQGSDEVYERSPSDTGIVVIRYMGLMRKEDYFEADFIVGRGNTLMKKLRLAAFRKTAFGNMMIKTATYNVSANNY